MTDDTAREIVFVSPDSPIDQALSLMDEYGIHHLPVVHQGVVLGMLSDRDLLLSVGWKLSIDRQVTGHPGEAIAGPRVVSEIMSEPVLTLTTGASFAEIADLMTTKTIGAVPLCRDGVIEQLVTESDLLQRLVRTDCHGPEARRLLSRSVEALMTAKVVTAGPKTSIIEILTSFKEHHIRHVPIVVDRALVGMISDRDVLRALGEATIHDAQAERKGDYYMGPQRALDIMTRGVRVLACGDKVSVAIREMLDHRIHCLPVVDRDRLVGILTETDVVRAVARQQVLDEAC